MPTEKEIQDAFYKQNHARYEMIAKNIYIDSNFGEADLLGLRHSGRIDEIEIKLSISDFKQDFNKTVRIIDESVIGGFPVSRKMFKHDALKQGLNHCNYFSFLIPESLVGKCDLPQYAGLYIFYNDKRGVLRIKQERSARLLHKRKLDIRLKYEAARKMANKFWRNKGLFS